MGLHVKLRIINYADFRTSRLQVLNICISGNSSNSSYRIYKKKGGRRSTNFSHHIDEFKLEEIILKIKNRGSC